MTLESEVRLVGVVCCQRGWMLRSVATCKTKHAFALQWKDMK